MHEWLELGNYTLGLWFAYQLGLVTEAEAVQILNTKEVLINE